GGAARIEQNGLAFLHRLDESISGARDEADADDVLRLEARVDRRLIPKKASRRGEMNRSAERDQIVRARLLDRATNRERGILLDHGVGLARARHDGRVRWIGSGRRRQWLLTRSERKKTDEHG